MARQSSSKYSAPPTWVATSSPYSRSCSRTSSLRPLAAASSAVVRLAPVRSTGRPSGARRRRDDDGDPPPDVDVGGSDGTSEAGSGRAAAIWAGSGDSSDGPARRLDRVDADALPGPSGGSPPGEVDRAEPDGACPDASSMPGRPRPSFPVVGLSEA